MSIEFEYIRIGFLNVKRKRLGYQLIIIKDQMFLKWSK